MDYDGNINSFLKSLLLGFSIFLVIFMLIFSESVGMEHSAFISSRSPSHIIVAMNESQGAAFQHVVLGISRRHFTASSFTAGGVTQVQVPRGFRQVRVPGGQGLHEAGEKSLVGLCRAQF